jgi:hypothetical protein
MKYVVARPLKYSTLHSLDRMVGVSEIAKTGRIPGRRSQMKTRGWIIGSALLTLGMGAVGLADTSGPLSFQAWKSSRVEEAKSSLDHVQINIQAEAQSEKASAPLLPDKPLLTIAKGSSGKSEVASQSRVHAPVGSAHGDLKLSQAQLNYETAQELTINDYFALYISQLRGKESFVEAAKKLNPDEMAELMMAYSKSLSGEESSGDASKASKIGL